MSGACVRCGKPVEPGRQKYCSDACRDSQQRDVLRTRAPKGIPRKTFRVYDYREPKEAVHE